MGCEASNPNRLSLRKIVLSNFEIFISFLWYQGLGIWLGLGLGLGLGIDGTTLFLA